ncbi:3-oxoacyl-[acyl-carrier-protein] reductase FabG [Pseudomonas fluorescens]|uniref:SDR family NAD(P)-dependent oxidoreductase n=1 Tax=Pseudomonas fluorescens TaxID=294 RepID=UPI001254B492|nr:SDR family oxidoreductase [Pseudomonas fluorescens]CAG8867881.1 3-oxoacyl-[acyl-carrier-protein] reductase FabG [Pseudomonas fluorescens]VVP81576.1 3-oxoacyl-[acyl-carrier-protein] reductase FabG [Pseudomonas fluorescens]
MDTVLSAFGLHERTILVTGASSGIGRQIALSCAGAGATLVVTGRSSERLQALLDELGGAPHRMLVADLNDEAQVDALSKEVGKIDGLVHSAGISALSPLRMASREHIESQLATNVIAPMLLTRYLLARQAVRNGGSIVFISSISAHIGVRGVGAYSASKAAVEGLARSLSIELAPRKIRVNCLAPGLVQTPMLDAALATTGNLDATVARYPLGIGQPEDVANATIFFLSQASRWITGRALVLDGGHTVE